MLAKDYRGRACDNLKGKWGTFALIMLIYTLIDGLISSFAGFGEKNSAYYFISALGIVVAFVCSGPLEFGLSKSALLVANGENIQVENLFDGFKMFTKTFFLFLINSVLTFLWSLLFIIPGIIKALSYSMSYFILQEKPELTSNEARKESMRIMQGNKWRLFCLQFSFMGWYLLSVLTLGILLLWVEPYVKVACAEFYKDIKKNNA